MEMTYTYGSMLLIYGFLGWCCEVLFAAHKSHKFVNRGFLNGPICPIYGFGMVFLYMASRPFEQLNLALRWIIAFVFSMVIASVVELLTGWILEKFFHKKWWDYSNIKFNYKSRICLLGAVCFGTLCLLLCKVIHPLFADLISLVPQNVQFWLAVILVIIFAVDCLMTILFFRKNKSTGKEENYENQLPPLDLQTLFGNIGDKIRIRFGK